MLPFTSCFVGPGQSKITLRTALDMTVSAKYCQEETTFHSHSSSTYPVSGKGGSGDLLRNDENCPKAEGAIEPINVMDQEFRQRHRSRLSGRFLTLRKRRKKKTTPCTLIINKALIDDVYSGPTQTILEQVSLWPFNAFSLDRATGGRPLPTLCFHLFHYYGLLSHFRLDPVKVFKFFSLVEDGYRSSNPYHNAIHATDVTQAMHCFLMEEKIRSYLTPLEIAGSLIAAMAHDLDHPGVNQPFLVATSNHLASLYNNDSVLENHHWRSAIGCLMESGMMDTLDRSASLELQGYIKSLILATDIARQQEFLSAFQERLQSDSLDLRLPEHRHFILQIALKCADISNPCRPWEVSRAWSIQVTEEFYRQGDLERNLGLAVTPLCDRFKSSISKIQLGFFRFIVAPLFEEWHRFHATHLSASMLNHLRSNEQKWDSILQYEESGNVQMANVLFEGSYHMFSRKSPIKFPTSQHLREVNFSRETENEDTPALSPMNCDSFHVSNEQFAVNAQERENVLPSSGNPPTNKSLSVDRSRRHPPLQDPELSCHLLKKEKKTKKVFYQNLPSFLSPSSCVKKHTLHLSKTEGSRLAVRRGSAPTTFQTLGPVDVTRIKRSSNVLNSIRNNSGRMSKYSDQNGPSLRRRGSLPYDLGKKVAIVERAFPCENPESVLKLRRGSAPSSMQSNINAAVSRKDAEVAFAVALPGFKRDCMNSFPVRDWRTRSFRRRRSGGPELFASIVWRSCNIIAQLPRLPQSVHIKTVYSSQEISNHQAIGIDASEEDRPFLGRRGSGPVELLAEMWKHRGSRSERSSVDSDDYFLKPHLSRSCYNSLSSDGLHRLDVEDLNLFPEYSGNRRRSSYPFVCPSVLGSTSSLAIR